MGGALGPCCQHPHNAPLLLLPCRCTEARQRAAADQALRFLRAHATVLAVSVAQ